MKKESTYNDDCFNVFPLIENNSIDLIITDLPYGISRKSGYTANSPENVDYIKKYGKHKIEFGEWDNKELNLDDLSTEYYRMLRKGGVAVIFYDIWGATDIKEAFSNFKSPRIGIWNKTNPVPINSKKNLLSNANEYFFSFVKDGNPTYNGEYHSGIFKYPICHGKERTEHPTQKPLGLIKEIIELYSDEGDLVMDSTAGVLTLAVACKQLGRNYIVIEKEKKYFDIGLERIKKTNRKLF